MCSNNKTTNHKTTNHQQKDRDCSVTILVPIYGVERYIEQCAESLFGQTYHNLEYVFVDDCTPDESISVLRQVMERHPERSKHVRIVRHEQNKGLGAARQTGLEMVTTDCFTIVDSDDILPLDAIETLVMRMMETDADIVEGAYQEYSNGSMELSVLPYHGCQQSYIRKLLCQNVVKNNVWAKLYRSDVINRVDKLFEQGIDYAEDYSATTRLAMVARRAWTDKVVYYYRTDNISSYTKKMSHKNVVSCLRAVRRVLSQCHRQGHLSMAAEIGVLNMYRVCRNNGVAIQEADDILQYVPQHITASVLYGLLRSEGILYKIGDVLYRILRMTVA